MLGTVAGVWISVILVFIGCMLLVSSMIGESLSSATPSIDRHSILYFDLSGTIAERATKQPFVKMIQHIESNNLTLDEMLNSLEVAADNDNIEGLYIKCNGASMGFAAREELHEAISKFKESGKWVTAYADNYSQEDYMTATIADSLFLNPVGAINIHGIGAVSPFFKGLLDKLGVKMQIIKVGTFKSAVEPYILNQMSEPARLQMQQYCDSLWSNTAGTIAANRQLSIDEIYKMAPEMLVASPAEIFVENGLVDTLKYERQVDAYLRELTGLDDDEDLRLVSPSKLLETTNFSISDSKDSHIAVYYAIGEIYDEGEEGIIGSVVVNDIIELADDENVAGLVFRVNSPGGSAFASEQIWESIQYFKSTGKPVYVSMGDYAASGGYYISCGADSIYADRTTLTGSIGVFGMIPDISGLVTDKLGINFSTVETNPNAVGITTNQAMTPTQYRAMQNSVENIYELFTQRVATGRGMLQDDVKKIAEGRVWTGGRAIELGLVDHIGSLATTIEAMADQLGLSCEDVVEYPISEEKMWERMLRQSGGFGELKTDTPFDEETMRQLYHIKQLRSLNPIQARMEEVIFNN